MADAVAQSPARSLVEPLAGRILSTFTEFSSARGAGSLSTTGASTGRTELFHHDVKHILTLSSRMMLYRLLPIIRLRRLPRLEFSHHHLVPAHRSHRPREYSPRLPDCARSFQTIVVVCAIDPLDLESRRHRPRLRPPATRLWRTARASSTLRDISYIPRRSSRPAGQAPVPILLRPRARHHRTTGITMRIHRLRRLSRLPKHPQRTRTGSKT